MVASLKKRFQLGPDFKIVGRIGKGSMGDVCWAKHGPSGNIDVAVKKIENIWFEDEETRRVARELNLLRAMAPHPNMVKLLDVRLPEGTDVRGLAKDPASFWEEGFFDTVYLVFEFIPTDAGKLFHSELHLVQLQVKSIVYNLLQGIAHMHAVDVIHRDIKLANVLVDPETC